MYNVYGNVRTSKKLCWKKRYKIKDVIMKKFIGAKFLDYKIVDSKVVIAQV